MSFFSFIIFPLLFKLFLFSSLALLLLLDEYLNGKRNGKGKEYCYGELGFEGEYLNGERNGKGKEYYSDGKLEFEGE